LTRRPTSSIGGAFFPAFNREKLALRVKMRFGFGPLDGCERAVGVLRCRRSRP
jgi:hypothetical protein